ncbi:MiaB/RimO family radical SAM methylthiotransferase [Occallatibacter savannae]|uniref:MiaB/RimO family radical SAM methylthiotransferase n=1 Tax=Occallatibacter savannae TaxID=1002691 RepID=UPI000D691B44|nr:MiaB/RimO family radical SAM methylthiotransferase [Occallatibacter savannae]
MAPTFHIENFGCRAARADGEAIAAILRNSGATEHSPTEADVVIVNTCSVTGEADREARAYIRRTHRTNPAARIIATGCYAQRAPGELAELPGVSAVIGNSHKALAPKVAIGLMPFRSTVADNLIQIQAASAAAAAPQVLADDTFAHSFLEEAPITPGAQTRPNLKIQEGCSNRCSFCVIPQTRGHSRSLSSSAILAHICSFVAAGGNELVLSGINLGRWGRDLDRSGSEPRSLAALVRVLFDQTVLPRLRLSSIEPMDWDSDLIALVRDFAGNHPGFPPTGPRRWGGRLARHAHLPLQSGSDSVLRRMHRRYRPWHYAEKVAELLRAAGPALTLGADVMVGFPGETDREFHESYDFIRSLPFGYLHLFPFSPRPGTRAWHLHAENPVPTSVVNERITALRALGSDKIHAHRSRFIGSELPAITLHTPAALAASGRTSALTDNFLPVELACSLPANQLLQIRITAIAPDHTLLATPVQIDQFEPSRPVLVGAC